MIAIKLLSVEGLNHFGAIIGQPIWVNTKHVHGTQDDATEAALSYSLLNQQEKDQVALDLINQEVLVIGKPGHRRGAIRKG